MPPWGSAVVGTTVGAAAGAARRGRRLSPGQGLISAGLLDRRLRQRGASVPLFARRHAAPMRHLRAVHDVIRQHRAPYSATVTIQLSPPAYGAPGYYPAYPPYPPPAYGY